jgi:hypothetical protein
LLAAFESRADKSMFNSFERASPQNGRSPFSAR